MPYCTQTDILSRLDAAVLVQLTDDNDTGGIVDDVVSGAISDADAEIDGYCGKRYAVPFSTVPDVIRKISADIAIYNLYSRRRGAPESRAQRYKDAIRFLTDVAKGTASLGEDDPDGVPGEANTPEFDGPDRVFSRDSMKNW